MRLLVSYFQYFTGIVDSLERVRTVLFTSDRERTVKVKIDDREFESPLSGLLGSIYLEALVQRTN